MNRSYKTFYEVLFFPRASPNTPSFWTASMISSSSSHHSSYLLYFVIPIYNQKSLVFGRSDHLLPWWISPWTNWNLFFHGAHFSELFQDALCVHRTDTNFPGRCSLNRYQFSRKLFKYHRADRHFQRRYPPPNRYFCNRSRSVADAFDIFA